MSLPEDDVFPDFIVLTSPHKRLSDHIPRSFEANRSSYKTMNFGGWIGVFLMP